MFNKCINNYCIATVFNGDNVALVPQYINQEWIIRLINLDEWARKFAEKRFANVIFLNSCCRSPIANYKGFKDAFTDKDKKDYRIQGENG